MTTEMDLRALLADAIERSDREKVDETLWQLVDTDELGVVLRELDSSGLARLADLLGDERFGEFLAELEPSEAADVLQRLSWGEAADVLEAMAPDDAADVFAELEPEDAGRILVAMEPLEAQELQELLSYPPDTAGGRMTPAYVALAPDLRVDQAIQALRQLAEAAETIYYVYVTDPDGRLLGVVSMRELVLSHPSRRVGDVMQTDLVSVQATADQEEAARLLVEEDLLALPVIDERNRLLGIITVDDVADILEREATEDIERLGGSQPLEVAYMRASPVLLWRKRVGWLLLLFIGSAYTVTVTHHYEELIDEVTALALFIPLLIGTGGNAGSQVVTTLVRAIALEGISLRDVPRILPKEVMTALMLGLVMAVFAFGRASIEGVGSDISLTVACAIFAIVLWAVSVATLLPPLLKRLRIDPAVVSAPLIATLVDGTGLIIYFNVARFVLDL